MADFTIFTKTCKRDAERFDFLVRTRAKFLPDVEHFVRSDDPVEDGHGTLIASDLPSPWFPEKQKLLGLELRRNQPYMWQQFCKLQSAPGLVTFHVDSDMWFDDDSRRDLEHNRLVWVFETADRMSASRRSSMKACWDTIDWLIAPSRWPAQADRIKIAAMLNTRGWWIRSDVLDALHRRIEHVHGKPLLDLLPELATRSFREYELYANFVWLFWHDSHVWVPLHSTRFVPSPGRDKALFVNHVSSADEIRPEVRKRQLALLEEP